MDTINLIFISLIIIGFFLIIYSLIKVQKEQQNKTEIFYIEEAIKELKEQIDIANDSIIKLNSLKEEVFLQFQEKNQELLSLYDFLESQSLPKNTNTKKLPPKILKKYEKVLQMKQKGLSNSEIAKNTSIDKGEIQLILNLLE